MHKNSVLGSLSTAGLPDNGSKRPWELFGPDQLSECIVGKWRWAFTSRGKLGIVIGPDMVLSITYPLPAIHCAVLTEARKDCTECWKKDRYYEKLAYSQSQKKNRLEITITDRQGKLYMNSE